MAKKALKTIGRAIYKAKTAPLQAASKIASKVAPGSKVDKALGKAAKPFKSGGMASKGKATGAATKGFGKAYMKGKRS
jgi:hypothetical protein